MDKNWLIRTKSNHILGPVSKEKVLELYHNGSILPDDEICSGNGYWFFIREQELVEKYLLGAENQGFNPLSEAINYPPVKSEMVPEDKLEGTTLMTNIKTSPVKQVVFEEKKPDVTNEKIKEEKVKISKFEEPKRNSIERRNPEVLKQTHPVPEKKQLWLKYLGIIGFILLFLLIYFRKTILYNFFNKGISQTFYFIDSASADDEIKKKIF
jgi:hypothetical protein